MRESEDVSIVKDAIKHAFDKLISSRRLWAAAGAVVFVRLAWVGSMDIGQVMMILGVIVAFLFKRDSNGNGGQ